MSDNEGSVPTEGIDYGDTMVVWPSTGRIPGGDVKPGGSSGLAPSMPPGWGGLQPTRYRTCTKCSFSWNYSPDYS